MEINDKLKSQSVIKILEEVFSLNKKINTEVLETPSDEKMFETINKLVHFGWKKEAIPVSFVKKSFITKFFERLFLVFVIFRNISCFKFNNIIIYKSSNGRYLSKDHN